MESSNTPNPEGGRSPYLDITSNDFLYLMDKTTLTPFEVKTLRYFINNLNSYFCFLGDYEALEGGKAHSLKSDVDSV